MNCIKKLKLIFCLFLIFSISNLWAQHLEFESVERTEGTAFFAIDKTSGQISFMLDYGSEAGNWKNYGGIIERNPQGKNLTFYALKRTDGTAFFCMDGTTGQVYFMLDYVCFQAATRTDGTAFFAMDGDTGQVYFMLDHGSNAGNWKSYGGTIPK